MSIAREPGTARIYTEDKPRRNPPVSERGVIGWVRHNLFRTPLDAFVTLASAYIVYVVVAGTVTWAVADANWFAITRNLSLFMLGPLQADSGAVLSVQIMTLILAFAVGLSFAAWAHIGRRSWIALAIVAAACLVIPTIISRTLPLPPTVLSAGSAGIVSGSLTETPNNEIAFLGAAGEIITIRVAGSDTADDTSLTGIAAFADRATDAIINAARARVAALARLDEVNALLEDPDLSNSQRALLIPELEGLIAASDTAVIEKYAINSAPVTVRLLSGDLNTVLAGATLTTDSNSITATLPVDGWYVLEKSVEGGSIGIIETQGIFPHLERQFTQTLRDADGEIVLGVNGLPRQQLVTQYLRIVDDLLVEINPPRRDGTDLRRFMVIDNQYRGERPLGDYLVLHFGPFIERTSRALIPVLLAVFAGYIIGHGLNRYAHSSLSLLGALVLRFETWVGGLIPVPVRQRVRSLSGRAGLIRYVPVWLRENWLRLVALGALTVLFKVTTEFDWFNSLMASAFVVVFVLITINMLRPAPGIKYARRFISWLWFVMPFIIFFLVAGTDLGRWGGLFLTFMLTIVGIVASFPIGVLLALGRRADGLPVVKYLCIAFIELVRGVPLITVLFLASLALPLVSPALSTVPQAVRAMVAITLFSAAYLAENVRGGLQSIPPGQAEAARALGMNPVQVTLHITLPQALRAVIPALVGQCIALFKDTSLVAIVGLLDLTKSADSVVAQAEYIGLRREAYIFISIVYFVFSYAMAYVSRKLEQSGSGSARETKL